MEVARRGCATDSVESTTSIDVVLFGYSPSGGCCVAVVVRIAVESRPFFIWSTILFILCRKRSTRLYYY